MNPPERPLSSQVYPGRAGEVFRVFLLLGLTSFGGPVAHLGYFREAFVQRRRWLDEAAYADLVALCQFLPGPASSQVGMAIGLNRAGYLGMLAAWTAFTLPSALMLVAFAFGLDALGTVNAGLLAGLKAAAVAVVAHALIGMARTLSPDRERATIAALALCITLALPSAFGQVAAILVGGFAGVLWLRAHSEAVPQAPHIPLAATVGPRAAIAALVAFFTLLALLPLGAHMTGDAVFALVDSFYRTGALVFGGGHVVLPLLQAEMVQTGQVAHDAFLAGYGAAQAVPGPLFTFAAYLGAVKTDAPTGLLGAALATVAIFLPSALLIIGGVRYWDLLRANALARRALMGVNAAVVGLLGAAFYDPVFAQGAAQPSAFAIAVLAFVALALWKSPPWAVVASAGALGALAL